MPVEVVVVCAENVGSGCAKTVALTAAQRLSR
jgi:hypothetical protein